jgi:hypothetical protein
MSISSPVARLAARITTRAQTLPPGARNATGVASTFIGTVAAGRRDSVLSQAIAYSGVLGLLASAPAYGAGRAGVSVAARRAAESVASGATDEATAAARLVTDRERLLRPAKLLALGSAGLALGAVGANLVIRETHEGVRRTQLETDAATRPAAKGGG